LPDNQGVRFRVYAPGANTVSVAGDFNNWDAQANMMVRDADGYYETVVSSAIPGQEYKFVVNDTLWRKDPWSLQVTGSQEAANSVIVDLNAYEWQADNWQTPRMEELVIYQLHIKGFQYNGDGLNYEYGNVFNDFVDTKLDYLEELGVNCIHIMPVSEFPGEDSWGYNTVFFNSMESSYGTAQDFQRLVDECHLRGISVIVGIVYNHTAGNDNVHFWDFDGTAYSEFGGNGQFYYDDERALTFWGPEPNYGATRTRERLFENARMFAELYRVDGFRMDAVGFVRGESGDGNDWFGYQSDEGWQFLRDFNNIVRSYQNGAFMSIAEDIASNPSITQNASEGGAGFLSQWAETNLRDMMANPDDSGRGVNDVRRILEAYYPVNYGLFELVKYHSSHDKVGALNDGPRLPVLIGDTNSWFTRRRSMLANALIIFSPGAPLIFMGDEKYSVRSFSEQVGTGLDWSLRDRNRGFFEFSRDLFALKTQSPAMHQNNLEITETVDDQNLISWRRWGNDGEVIVVAANFSAFDRDFGFSFPYNEEWHELINSSWSHYGESDNTDTNRTFNVSNNFATINVPAYSFIALGTSQEILPGRVWDVTPLNNGFSTKSNTSISWEPSSRTDSYDLYIGNSFDAVENADTNSDEFIGEVTATSFDIADIMEGSFVYWRVDSRNSVGTTKSEVFQFQKLGEDIATEGRIFWTPAEPVSGESVTVSYVAEGSILDGLAPLNAHQGFTIDEMPWQEVVSRPMSEAQPGVFEVSFQISTEAEEINLVFNHQESIWDNNDSNDWFIPVQPAQSLEVDDMFMIY